MILFDAQRLSHPKIRGLAEKLIGWLRRSCTFSDTNYIVSFEINSHRISNLGLWKGVHKTFRKRPGKLTKGVLFHQDNAPAHMSVVAMAAVRDCGFEVVDHPSYSPDLAPSDYFLFPNRNKNGWEAVSDRCGHVCSWLFRGSEWELLYHGTPNAATPMEEVCGPQGRLYVEKHKPHLVKLFWPYIASWSAYELFSPPS